MHYQDLILSNPFLDTFCSKAQRRRALFTANKLAVATAASPAPLAAQPLVALDGSVAAAAHNTGRKIGIAAALVIVVMAAILLL